MVWRLQQIAQYNLQTDANEYSFGSGSHNFVVTPAGVKYAFFGDNNYDLMWAKCTDGLLFSNPAALKAATVEGWSVWADWWTPGNSGTKIHIAYVDRDSHNALYRSIDTADDSLGTETIIFDGASAGFGLEISIARARGGNLCCAYDIDDGTEQGFAVSTDDGATWVAKANPHEATDDSFQIYPGNEADSQDMWLVFFDITANALTVKTYDDSADSWSESATIVSATEPSFDWQRLNFYSAAVRHSDNHLIIAIWNLYDNAAADLVVVDFNGAGSFTVKTNALTNANNCGFVAVQVRPNDEIVLYQTGKSDGTDAPGTSAPNDEGRVRVFRLISRDGGTSWSGQEEVAPGWRASFFSLNVDPRSGDCCGLLHSVGGYIRQVWVNQVFEPLAGYQIGV